MDFGKWIVALFDTSKIAGWVRAGVSGVLTLVATKYLGDTIFKDILSTTTIDAIAIMASTLVVGLWSQLAKKLDPDYKEPPKT